MGKVTKSKHSTKKVLTDFISSNQTNINNLSAQVNNYASTIEKTKLNKQIIIHELTFTTKEDELAIKTSFKLSPSKIYFSKVWLELYFDNQKINCTCITIPQGPLMVDDFELTPVLDMHGISAGTYTVKVEIIERWNSGEILTIAFKEAQLNYIPLRRQDRLIKVPTFKSIAGENLSIASEADKSLYHNIIQELKKDLTSKRDQW